jgi:hypothetical protein
MHLLVVSTVYYMFSILWRKYFSYTLALLILDPDTGVYRECGSRSATVVARFTSALQDVCSISKDELTGTRIF